MCKKRDSLKHYTVELQNTDNDTFLTGLSESVFEVEAKQTHSEAYDRFWVNLQSGRNGNWAMEALQSAQFPQELMRSGPSAFRRN